MTRPRPVILPSMTPAERRRWALGPDLWDWCDKVEPILRGEVQAGMSDTANLAMVLREAVGKLTLMPCDSPAAVAAHDAELARLVELRERIVATQEREVRMFGQLSAGGAASYWAAMQKGARKQPDEDREERRVQPSRRFDRNRVLQQQSQPVDAEVVAED